MNCQNLKLKYTELLAKSEEFNHVNKVFQQMKDKTQYTHAQRREVAAQLLKLQEEIKLLIKNNFEDLLFMSIDSAKKILDKDIEYGKTHCFGPIEIEKAFGIKVDQRDIPPIPFSRKELKRARELKQFLILRTNIAPDGEPLTMKKLDLIIKKLYNEFESASVLKEGVSMIDILEKESFYHGGNTKIPVFFSMPKFGWALTGEGVMPDSVAKDYLEQNEEIVQYLETEIFKGGPVPMKYQDAIDEFKTKKNQLMKLRALSRSVNDYNKDSEKEYNAEIGKLKLDKLTRQNPAEVLYDLYVYFRNNDQRLLMNNNAWTNCGFVGHRITVGTFNKYFGVHVGIQETCQSSEGTGVVFSRHF